MTADPTWTAVCAPRRVRRPAQRPVFLVPEVTPAMYRAYRDIGGQQRFDAFRAQVALMHQHLSAAYIHGIGDRSAAWQAFADSLTDDYPAARAASTEAVRVFTAAGGLTPHSLKETP